MQVIERDGVTHATFVPTMLQRMLDDPALAGYRLSSLRYVSYGAAPMPTALLNRTMARLPHVKFVQSYGMTEASPVVTVLTARDHERGQALTSAGRPALTAEIRILDSQGLEAPNGSIGEIVVRGPMVMKGYWRNPEATAQAIRDGWLHTGDLGYMDDAGYLFVVDRLKDMIISGGENVYSTEVEQALASHPDVAECAVFGLPDESWGERVHAVVVPRPGAEPDAEALTRHCRGIIAAYKCPRSYELRLEPLPISNVNKVLKRELRAQALARLDR
jgi:long-chain acyl-CoA synthetase